MATRPACAFVDPIGDSWRRVGSISTLPSSATATAPPSSSARSATRHVPVGRGPAIRARPQKPLR